MVLKRAKRSDVDPFIVMEILRAAGMRTMSGGDALHLEIGQPGTPAPLGAREAAKQAIDREILGYTEAFGMMSLRERIARHYRDKFAIDVDPARIAATTGSTAAFVLAFISAFAPGDRVALTAPGYPCYRNIMTALGIEPVPIPVGPETNWKPTPGLLEQAGPLDGFIVASPSNPTGTIFAPSELKAIANWCDAAGVRLISDEIYHNLTYEGEDATALSFTDSAFIVNSFSKYFSMTGWRIGWMILPEEFAQSVERLAQNLYISPPTLSQVAAEASMDCVPELEKNKSVYAANRQVLLKALPEAGITGLAPPDGAFYIYANVAHLTNDSVDFCGRVLDATGVAITPGLDFDQTRGRQYVRLSYAGPTAEIEEAASRLTDFLAH